MRAERSGNGFVLNGAKQFVVQGASADWSDRCPDRRITGRTDGLTLFAVEKDARGLDVESVALGRQQQRPRG